MVLPAAVPLLLARWVALAPMLATVLPQVWQRPPNALLLPWQAAVMAMVPVARPWQPPLWPQQQQSLQLRAQAQHLRLSAPLRPRRQAQAAPHVRQQAALLRLLRWMRLQQSCRQAHQPAQALSPAAAEQAPPGHQAAL